MEFNVEENVEKKEKTEKDLYLIKTEIFHCNKAKEKKVKKNLKGLRRWR